MKLIFDSLDALLAELRENHVRIVRVSLAVHAETGARMGGIPHFTARVVVTGALDTQFWAEWRYWVGRQVAEIGDRGLLLPVRLRERLDQALAEVSRRVDDAGFLIREGILTHDGAAIDTFRALTAPGQPAAPAQHTDTAREGKEGRA
jgi:hypothetical protein